MPTTHPEHVLAKSTQIFLSQFQQCGFVYAFRKFLAITFLRKLSAHIEVAHALSLPHTRELARQHPRSAFKYLRKYLARSFDIHTRSAILSNHYRFLNNWIRPDFIGRICRGKIMLWECTTDEHRYGISLSYPKNEEGELFLEFSEDDAVIFTLSFTFAPGKALGLRDKQVSFIGRVQGVNNCWESIRRATKSCQDIAPATLLLDAVRAISLSMNITGIVGVSASNQVCLCGSRKGTALSSYDEFWVSAGASAINDLGYYLPTITEEKPLSEIKNNHRSRVKRKRQFRNALTEKISTVFESQCTAPTLQVSSSRLTGMRFGNYSGTLVAMNDLSFATSASITSQR
ncbi:DUF535 family protein [Sideroxydans lithotrophicus]|uniref:DUF535 domain-containing protein n=1 Tax=Sideroxydans lithotrophicus (strain ES-1) TaxID=580332 RepID=D5CUQ7_SIDLE|nr:DUF535 family protein [Sideroxydans lithotrophicus]ADE12444.1 protein of unknown function DUF535 [Sideroxydans lithotrophicus ES-1]